MHLAGRDLRQAAPGTATVTEVALRYGFWQFGRFAGAYQALFGERPSVTLGRASEQGPPINQLSSRPSLLNRQIRSPPSQGGVSVAAPI